MNFFDSIRETITDTSKVVVKKAKDVSEITRISTQITAEEHEIKQAYYMIGKKCYEENIGEISEKYVEEFERITASRARIAELKERQKEIRGIYKCSQCGSDVMLESHYCSKCGQKMEYEAKEEKKDPFAAEQSQEEVVQEKTIYAEPAAEQTKEVFETDDAPKEFSEDHFIIKEESDSDFS